MAASGFAWNPKSYLATIRNRHMLKAINLHKSFGKREVVRGVTMQVRRGEVVGLLGPNGAGKTTCFYMIVGLVPVAEGQILVDEVDVTYQPVNVRSGMGVGYLPQDASIFRKLSVADNIMAILEIRKDLDQPARKEIQQQLLEDLGIALAPLLEQLGDLAGTEGIFCHAGDLEPRVASGDRGIGSHGPTRPLAPSPAGRP